MTARPPRPDLPRVAIAATGRFHVLDLARELAALGHPVTFHSYVPKARAASFGLPKACQAGLSDIAAPWLAWARYAPERAPDLRRKLFFGALDRAMTRRLKPCDVFVALSGIYLDSLTHARETFGATVFVERGSTHVDAQAEILARTPGARPISPVTLARERESYHRADRIAVGSLHVAESFGHDPAAAGKLFVNPYGVDLEMFPRRAAPPSPSGGRLLFVGTWSYRKGADVLMQALDFLPGATLTHVGAIGDTPFPSDSRVTHVDPVDQSALSAYYQSADLFVMASREEGLAMVQIQALACGLPVVGTTRSGATTLVTLSDEMAERVAVAPTDDAEGLAAQVERMLSAIAAERLPEISEAGRARLSWRGYAERYSAELVRSLEERRS